MQGDTRPARWEYQVVEEPNAGALQDRLVKLDADGWEALNVACAADRHLMVLVRRPGATARNPLSDHSERAPAANDTNH
jgi:hypothetical protein